MEFLREAQVDRGINLLSTLKIFVPISEKLLYSALFCLSFRAAVRNFIYQPPYFIYYYSCGRMQKKTVAATFLDNFRIRRPEAFFKKSVLKYLRKFHKKQPCQSECLNSKSKTKNTLPWMFFRNLSRIFQNNYFVEHFRVAPFLIREVFCLNDSYLYPFWIV